MAKKIEQYDKSNNLIKIWNGMRDLLSSNPTYAKSNIESCMRKRRLGIKKDATAYGFMFNYSTEQVDKKIIKKQSIEINENGKEERWIDIKGFEDKYQISDHGRVYSVFLNDYLKQIITDYCFVRLNSNILYRIHELVAEYFIEKVPGKNIPHHIDNNPQNNHYTNIFWTDKKGNIEEYYDFMGYNRIIQYDGEKDELINDWDNIDDIIKKYPKFDKQELKNAIKNKLEYMGFYWDKPYPRPTKKVHQENPTLFDDEKFKLIEDIDNKNYTNYACSNYGLIYNINTGRYLSPFIVNDRQVIKLIADGDKKSTGIMLNKIVATLFCKKKKGDTVACFKYPYYWDTYYKNIEWSTMKEKMENTKGRKIKSINIKTNKETIYNSVIEAARSLGNLNTRRDIYKCANGKNKTTHGFKWEWIKID